MTLQQHAVSTSEIHKICGIHTRSAGSASCSMDSGGAAAGAADGATTGKKLALKQHDFSG
jgi:hypothetical protein